MAKKSSRTRAQRKREDYRKGGRVAYAHGGSSSSKEGQSVPITQPVPNTQPVPATPSYTQDDLDTAVAALNAGTLTAADLAKQYNVTEDYVNKNLKAINTSTGFAPPAVGVAPTPPAVADKPPAVTPTPPTVAPTAQQVTQAQSGGNKTITNPANLCESSAANGWIRGGLPSRELTRDKDYAGGRSTKQYV